MTTHDSPREGLSRRDLSPAEAVQRSGLSLSTIRRLIASGDLPARRVGPRLIRIRAADLDALGSPLGPGGA